MWSNKRHAILLLLRLLSTCELLLMRTSDTATHLPAYWIHVHRTRQVADAHSQLPELYLGTAQRDPPLVIGGNGSLMDFPDQTQP